MSFILGYKLSGNKKSLLRFENGIGKVYIMLPVNNKKNSGLILKPEFALVHLCVEVNPRFYRGKEKEQSDNKNGELKASRKV